MARARRPISTKDDYITTDTRIASYTNKNGDYNNIKLITCNMEHETEQLSTTKRLQDVL